MAKKNTKRRRHKRGFLVLMHRYRYLAVLLTLVFILASLYLFRYVYLRNINTLDYFTEVDGSDYYPVRGIDVSHHNEYINWQMLKEDRVSFVYMKSTEGLDHLDREYSSNYHLVKEVGLKIGTYHFYSFGIDGRGQALHFINNSNIGSGDILPAIDVEHSKTNRAPRTKDEYNRVIAELRNMEVAINKYYGVKPIIYTNKECYKLYIKDNFPDNPLWICDLHQVPVGDYEHWAIWQFSHTGKLNSVVGDVDLNFYRGTFEEFNSLLIP